jgi:hypothetical protein
VPAAAASARTSPSEASVTNAAKPAKTPMIDNALLTQILLVVD